MAKAKMKLAKAVGPLNKLNEFLSECVLQGYFQPEPASKYISSSLGVAPLSEENVYAPQLQKVRDLAQTSDIKLKKTDASKMLKADFDAKNYLDDMSGQIEKLHNDRELLTDQLQETKTAIEQYNHFTSITTNLEDLFSLEYIHVRFGYLPKTSMEKLKAYVDKPHVFFIQTSSDNANNWGLYVVPNEYEDEVDRVFAGLYFERTILPNSVGTPSEIIEQLKINEDILEQEIEKVDQQNHEFWKKQEKQYNEVYSYLEWYNALFEFRKYAVAMNDYFIYVGWLPEENLNEFKSYIEKQSDMYYEDENIGKQSNPPVKLENKKIFRPFEYIVDMFGMPSRTDVDVTAFVAITYTVIFGLMFGDVGQGVVLVLAGLFMWKARKMAMGKVLMYCGVSATLMGFVYGSFFGYEEVLNPLYAKIGLDGPPVSVMHSINGLLLFSIALGVGLLVVAMLINVYARIKCKEYGEALFSHNGIAGIILYLCGVALIYGFMAKKTIIPNAITLPLMGICLLIVFLKPVLAGLLSKDYSFKKISPLDYVLENFFELFEYILSYFSNTVSFLRVGAFVLVHAGMMMAVFSISPSKNIIVIIIGNILVIALEALFTSIQAIRLEFYEIFSRCYTGEGKKFIPAKIEFESKR